MTTGTVPPPPAPGLTARVPGRWRALAQPRQLVLALTALTVIYLALVPVGTMVVASLRSSFLSTGPASWTLSNYLRVLGSASFWQLAVNSFIYAGCTAVLATTIGFALAWLAGRTNTPARSFAYLAALVPLIIPGILATVAWALLLDPQTGPLNSLLRAVGLPAFNIYSLAGMVFVQTLHVTPVAFLMGVAAFRSMDVSFEEAALSCGMPPRRVLRAITIRLIRPAVASAALLVFVQTISTFEVPQLIGVPGHTFVFVSKIYDALQAFPADYGAVGVIGVFVLVIAAAGLTVARRALRGFGTITITGKGFRPGVTDLGRWRWAGLAGFGLYFLVSVILPLAVLIWSSLLPGYQPPSMQALHRLTVSNYQQIFTTESLLTSLRNSVITALVSALVVTLLSAVIAYLTVKTRTRGRALLDGLATVPIAVPSIIMGVGILYWYLVAPLPVHLYGTLGILIVAFVTIAMPYGMRYVTPGMAQISSELEDAATASGASWAHCFRRVYLPLLAPSLVAAFLYAMIVAFREISAAIFLYAQNTQVVSVSIYQLWSNGDYPVVAALGVLLVAVLALAVAAARAVGGRIGITGDRA